MSMIKVKTKDVPDFLKNSELYENIIGMNKNIDCSEDDTDSEDINDFEIPVLKKYYITKLSLNSVSGKENFAGVKSNLEQLGKIFEILRYWMVKDIPHEIYEYFEKNTHLNILLKNLPFKPGKTPYTTFFEKFKYFPHIEDFHVLIDLCGEKSMIEMARHNCFNLIKYAHKHAYPWNPKITKYIAKNGNLECLKYVHGHGCEFDVDTCDYAAESGNLECLKYSHTSGCKLDQTYLFAAKKGYLDCLKYCYDSGCKISKDAAKNVLIECFDKSQQPNSEKTLRIIECIKYLISKGSDYDIFIWRVAKYNHNLELLKFAHESFIETNIFHIDENPLIIMTQCGYFDGFKYIYNKGYFAKLTDPEIDTIIKNLIKRGNLDCLKIMHKGGFKFDDKICDYCINTTNRQNECYELIKYFHENNYKMNIFTLYHAKKKRYTKVIDYIDRFVNEDSDSSSE